MLGLSGYLHPIQEVRRNFTIEIPIMLISQTACLFTVSEGMYLFTSGVPDQTQDICCSYIEQSTSGRGIRLHSILFNVDDYDAEGAIPGRYANITRTAECLRNMAHCSKGRFHWFRETG